MVKPHWSKKVGMRDLRTLLSMCDDGMRDRRTFHDAWVPDYGKPDKDAQKVINDTKKLIAKYEALERLLTYEMAKRRGR